MTTRKMLFGVVVAALVLTGGRVASAAIVTEPAGLNPGDQYRLIFVTSTTTTATDTSAAYYNTFVDNLAQSVPELASLGVTWKVLGNLNGADPQVNTGTTGSDAIPTYRLDGTVFATSYPDLWDAPSVPVLYNELGQQVINTSNSPQVVGRVWTGMGEALSVPNWSAGGYIGNGGAGGSTGAGRPDNAYYTYGWYSLANTQEQHLYAMSDVITVQQIPEPSALALLALGLLGLAFVAWRRRK